MRDLGERNDIIKAINRPLADHGEERAPGSFVPRGEEAQTPITGRVRISRPLPTTLAGAT